MADVLPPEPNKNVKDCVFVIHGIRDKGFWTQKIARAIKQEAAKRDCEAGVPATIGTDGKNDQGSLRSFTGSYGYFAMAPFMFSWVRRAKVEWLMDRYTELRARYPQAEFSYVGHSNGTYLLADALRRYPAARFKHVIFAGSVVRQDYDWNEFLPPAHDPVPHGESDPRGRVTRVLNYVATNDWVVALMPKAVQPIRIFDLGSAGFDGFHCADERRLCEVKYVRGEHSAGIKETQWDEIAKFIVRGKSPLNDGNNQDYDKGRNARLVRWSEEAFWLFWVAIGGALLLGVGLLYWTIKTIGFLGVLLVVLFLLYFKLVKTFITRF